MKKPDKRITCQRRQFGYLVEIGYEWRAQEQHQIQAQAGYDIKPEYSIVIFVCHLFLVDKSGREATLLYRAGYEGENR